LGVFEALKANFEAHTEQRRSALAALLKMRQAAD
jgi:hypothetical protein